MEKTKLKKQKGRPPPPSPHIFGDKSTHYRMCSGERDRLCFFFSGGRQEAGGVGEAVDGAGVSQVVVEVGDRALARDDGLNEEAEHGNHGEAAVLDLLDLLVVFGEREREREGDEEERGRGVDLRFFVVEVQHKKKRKKQQLTLSSANFSGSSARPSGSKPAPG